MRLPKKYVLLSLIAFLHTPHANANLIQENSQLVYDTATNTSWTSDANLLATMEADQGYTPLITAIIAANNGVIHDSANSTDNGTYTLTHWDFANDGSGNVDWWGAQAFVNYLNTISYGGITGWALPSTPDNDSSVGFNQTSSQLGELFYTELGGTAFNPIPSSSLFTNQLNQAFTADYWSNEYSAYPDYAWYFSTAYGYQDFLEFKIFQSYNVWPVSSNNVLIELPIPASFWLFGSFLFYQANNFRSNKIKSIKL